MNYIERRIAQLEFKYHTRLLRTGTFVLTNLEYLYGEDDSAICLVESPDFEENTVAVFDNHTQNLSFKRISQEEIDKYRKIKQKWIDIAEKKGLK